MEDVMNRRIDMLIAFRGCALVALAAVIAPGAFAQPAPQVITVQNLADSGPGSLRQAIATANASANRTTIRFASGLSGTILLTSGELRISAGISISGPGADSLTISGNNASRVFTIATAATAAAGVAIDSVRITNGRAQGMGGGIYVQGAALTLSRVVISNNVVAGPWAGSARAAACMPMPARSRLATAPSAAIKLWAATA
jgi:hypothetical protein